MATKRKTIYISNRDWWLTLGDHFARRWINFCRTTYKPCLIRDSSYTHTHTHTHTGFTKSPPKKHRLARQVTGCERKNADSPPNLQQHNSQKKTRSPSRSHTWTLDVSECYQTHTLSVGGQTEKEKEHDQHFIVKCHKLSIRRKNLVHLLPNYCKEQAREIDSRQ